MCYPDIRIIYHIGYDIRIGKSESITEKNVRGGFQGTGLGPLDPESVISKLDVKLRTPTPVDGADELPAPPFGGGLQ